MDWHVIIVSYPLLLRGLGTSLRLAAMVICVSFPLGCLLAIGRLSHRRWISKTCAVFVNLMRSNPLVLVLFWFYFLIPILIGGVSSDLGSIIVAFVFFL